MTTVLERKVPDTTGALETLTIVLDVDTSASGTTEQKVDGELIVAPRQKIILFAWLIQFFIQIYQWQKPVFVNNYKKLENLFIERVGGNPAQWAGASMGLAVLWFGLAWVAVPSWWPVIMQIAFGVVGVPLVPAAGYLLSAYIAGRRKGLSAKAIRKNQFRSAVPVVIAVSVATVFTLAISNQRGTIYTNVGIISLLTGFVMYMEGIRDRALPEPLSRTSATCVATLLFFCCGGIVLDGSVVVFAFAHCTSGPIAWLDMLAHYKLGIGNTSIQFTAEVILRAFLGAGFDVSTAYLIGLHRTQGMSGLERQRAALAVAVKKGPPLIILGVLASFGGNAAGDAFLARPLPLSQFEHTFFTNVIIIRVPLYCLGALKLLIAGEKVQRGNGVVNHQMEAPRVVSRAIS